jgi:hypothetical protein
MGTPVTNDFGGPSLKRVTLILEATWRDLQVAIAAPLP